MGENILKNLKNRLEESLRVVERDLSTIRTGRAKPSLIENVKVEAYGSIMEVRELATINAPDPSLLVVSPWDKSVTESIEKAIRSSDLGLNPNVDGELIKVPVPTLTEERRKELVKLVSQKIESGRVLIRQVRGEAKEEIDDLEGQGGVSEDDIHNWLEKMQSMVDEYTDKVEKMGQDKEKDLMSI